MRWAWITEARYDFISNRFQIRIPASHFNVTITGAKYQRDTNEIVIEGTTLFRDRPRVCLESDTPGRSSAESLTRGDPDPEMR